MGEHSEGDGRTRARRPGRPEEGQASRSSGGGATPAGAGGSLRGAVRAVHGHDWRADPWSRGAYAYPTVGGARAFEALARPVDDTVFVAGEATCADAIGTVEGALASGRRAARDVARAFAPGGNAGETGRY